jgi:tRNA (mo5U34)-methyltransferase
VNDIDNLIASVSNWFHKIEVAPGVFTPGIQDSQGLLEHIKLPMNLSGMRVLDIGARDGFFSFECEKRGAAEVIALDYTSADSTGFNVAKQILGSKAKWINGNIYSLNELNLGKFDLILFLGVIYHLRHPYLAIDRIHDSLNVGGKVVVESHIIDGGFVDEKGDWINLVDLNPRLANLAVAQFYESGKLVKDKSNAWAPSIDTLNIMFKNSGFNVEYSWSYHFRGGLIATSVELESDHPRFMDSSESVVLKSPETNLVPKNI